jgi:transposase
MYLTPQPLWSNPSFNALAKNGHKGSRRKTPQKIGAHVEHRLEVCPCCGGELQRCKLARQRIIEDLPERITPIVTEHTVHRDYCPSCKKHVEPVVPDAMPNATLGHNVIALSSWFHYGLGVTIGQVRDILASHLHTDITAGGLLDGWRRLAEALAPFRRMECEASIEVQVDFGRGAPIVPSDGKRKPASFPRSSTLQRSLFPTGSLKGSVAA